MKVGVISDTHGQMELALSAAREFIFRGVDAVVHCGDVGCEMILIEMAALFHTLDIPLYVVLGNCDLQNAAVCNFPDAAGVKMMGRFAELNLDGARVGVLHSDDEHQFAAALESNQFHYIFFGHSHARRDETVGTARLINPGSAGRGMHPSCAVIDLTSGDASFITIRREF